MCTTSRTTRRSPPARRRGRACAGQRQRASSPYWQPRSMVPPCNRAERRTLACARTRVHARTHAHARPRARARDRERDEGGRDRERSARPAPSRLPDGPVCPVWQTVLQEVGPFVFNATTSRVRTCAPAKAAGGRKCKGTTPVVPCHWTRAKPAAVAAGAVRVRRLSHGNDVRDVDAVSAHACARAAVQRGAWRAPYELAGL